MLRPQEKRLPWPLPGRAVQADSRSQDSGQLGHSTWGACGGRGARRAEAMPAKGPAPQSRTRPAWNWPVRGSQPRGRCGWSWALCRGPAGRGDQGVPAASLGQRGEPYSHRAESEARGDTRDSREVHTRASVCSGDSVGVRRGRGLRQVRAGVNHVPPKFLSTWTLWAQPAQRGCSRPSGSGRAGPGRSVGPSHYVPHPAPGKLSRCTGGSGSFHPHGHRV